jgi:PAS domain S-box-containing protein
MNRFLVFFQIPDTTNPDDARRRRMLVILLVSTFLLTLFGLIYSVVYYSSSANNVNLSDARLIYLSGSLLLLATAVIFVINRFVSGQLASTMFLLFLLVLFMFTDSPAEVSNGRTLFVFAIPVVVSSLLLRPAASFVFAGLSGIEISFLAFSVSRQPNTPAIVGFFLLAVISWLSSRSLEQALQDLRKINAELDQRVEDRTHELSAALARELAEASKSHAILEGIADGVAVFDPNGISIVANPALGNLLGIPAERLMGVTVETVLQAGNTSSQERGSVLALFVHPDKDTPSVRLRWRDRTLLVNAAQVRSGLEAPIGTVVVFRDFTREAEVEQMKSTFVAMVSHELRTPLNAILGYAEMMREAVYGSLSPRQVGVVERIESGTRRLLGLVSDLLDQAQIDAGRMKIHIAEFKISDLVGALHAYMDKSTADKNLYLRVEVDPNMPPSVLGDAYRLGQVLLNLVGNAVKFTVTGGISVRIYRVDETRWRFHVADTGPGIPPEAQQYVFESFRQVEGVTTRAHGGIGLGLAIVKSLIGLMDGEILLSSEVGKGSTFTVTLPFEPSQEKL